MYLVISATRPSVTVHPPDTPKQVLRKRETEILESSSRAEFRGAVPVEWLWAQVPRQPVTPCLEQGRKLANWRCVGLGGLGLIWMK